MPVWCYRLAHPHTGEDGYIRTRIAKVINAILGYILAEMLSQPINYRVVNVILGSILPEMLRQPINSGVSRRPSDLSVYI